MRHFIIRHNRFTNNRARGVLIHGFDGLVEHNVFDSIQGAAIQIETGSEARWSEGHGAGNLVIRNNQFRNCDLNAWQMAVLYMGVYLPGGRTAYPIFEQILIERNTFVNCPRMAMFLSSCRDVRVIGNTIINANQIPMDAHTYGSSQQEKPIYDETYCGTIYLMQASDVELADNICFSTTDQRNSGIEWDTATTRNITARNNVGL
ncbi:right-handed parallel beta-helix repeat-containing protein [Paenibacillus sp. IB182496]|uniref:Right-handed parallel beta-helix repeat-containing protein n=1 Tax=Paenibacillus sabuli TaxID=2772509 RepID=A0A927GRP6_9BACL|nr:right-handed parallel beta-helix repeat-containing protein [Paenibacillus sabuli]MBD2845476.1 right-handed parallel beta-helix repeat-containing protein [Paenibacillus sabuli]